MHTKIVLERDRGEFVPSYGRKEVGTGDLHLMYRTSRNRRVAVLQLLGADKQWPNLYELKLVELGADRMRFVGSERVGNAWVVQEWIYSLG